MKITNNHTGPIGLPDGQVLVPNQPTLVSGWDQIKKNAVVQAWLQAQILTTSGGGSKTAEPLLLGSDLLPSQVHLVGDVAVALGDVVRRAHEVSGLSNEGWNELDSTIREAKLADAVEQMRSEAINAAEAEKAAAPNAGATGGGADKEALIARAKELGVDAKGNWGVPKLQAAIADAEKAKAGNPGGEAQS